jgi:hypothetical protein
MITLAKNWEWNSAVVYDDGYAINSFSARVHMVTGTDSQYEQGVAYHRMKWWMTEAMPSATLIHQKNPLLPIYQQTGQRIIILPEEPVDHLVSMMLFCKLNSMMQERITVIQIELTSTQGDRMWYIHSADDPLLDLDYPAWWFDSLPSWGDHTQCDTNVVDLPSMNDWHNLGLGWEVVNHQSNNVVFADFQSRNEN